MDNKKYRYEQATSEEVEAFNKEFQELLKKHGLVAETQPQIARLGETGDFSLRGIMLLSKAIEIVEVEKVVEGAVPSTDSEVNPQA